MANNGYVNGQAGAGVGAPAPVAAAASSAQPQQHTGITPAHGFRKAVKFGAKARVALIGVAGSGKSYTMLVLARALAGPTGKIACIDTEHGSLSKYAHTPLCPSDCADPHHFTFEVDEPDSYSTDYLLAQLTFAEQNGYAVFCVDSLSHFWMGKDGALEFADNAGKRSRDRMEGWKIFRPHERAMVDRFLASPCHVIATMRTKTDYEEQIVDGKKKRVKIGLAPVQRDGLEYEFDLVGSMDDENNLLVDKTRCPVYSEERLRVASKPNAEYFRPFIAWLAGAERPAVNKPQPAETIDTGGHPVGTRAAADYVAQQKIAALSQPKPEPPAGPKKYWSNKGEMKRLFAQVRERVGEAAYLLEMERADVREPGDFRSSEKAMECYERLLAIAQTEVA